MQTLQPNRRPTQRLPVGWPAIRFIVVRMANLKGMEANDSLHCGREMRYHLLDGERFSGLLIGRLGSGVVEMPHSWATLPAGPRVRCRPRPGGSVLAAPGPLAITMSRRSTCASTEYWHAHSQPSLRDSFLADQEQIPARDLNHGKAGPNRVCLGIDSPFQSRAGFRRQGEILRAQLDMHVAATARNGPDGSTRCRLHGLKRGLMPCR